MCGRLFKKPYVCSRKEWVTRKSCSKRCQNRLPRSIETRLKMRLAKLGRSSWNKGKRLSMAHRQALRKKHIMTKEGSAAIREARKGHRPWNKIGDGITPINERIRKSSKYRDWRQKVFERDDYTCQACEKRGGSLHADHIKPFALYPKLRFSVDNGRTLCIFCHRKTKSFGINQHTYPQLRKIPQD